MSRLTGRLMFSPIVPSELATTEPMLAHGAGGIRASGAQDLNA